MATKRNHKQTDEWLTRAEAAEVAGVSERTIQNWQATNRIKSRLVRRGLERRREYLRSSVAAFAAETVEE